MTDPVFDVDATEADVAEQLIPVDIGADDPELTAAPPVVVTDADASEADLIDQAIAVPLADDPEFDR